MEHNEREPCPNCGKQSYKVNRLGLVDDSTYYCERICRSCLQIYQINKPLVLQEDGLYTYIQGLEGQTESLHRLVWEWANKKRLATGTVVHHLNSRKRDNRPPNLYAVFENEHPRPHRTVQALRNRIKELEEEVCELKLGDLS